MGINSSQTCADFRPTVAPMTTETVRDFSASEDLLRFSVRPDTFEAHAMISAGRIMDLASLESRIEAAEGGNKLNAIAEVFQVALLPESYDRFAARLRSDTEPIGIGQVTDIVSWLMEHYAGRPTAPPTA